jgi:hypothetical protein
MAEQEHHHHHHHHRKEDDASRFKRESLLWIKRRRVIKKWAFRALCALAVIMAIAVAVVYNIK